MPITKELLDAEIRNAEIVLAKTQREAAVIEGGLSVLRQVRDLLDKEPDKPPE